MLIREPVYPLASAAHGAYQTRITDQVAPQQRIGTKSSYRIGCIANRMCH
jgi:hypothetical protein